MFVYELFSLLVAILISKSFQKDHCYIIDIEYFGQDEILRKYILSFTGRMNLVLNPNQITFKAIGKRSVAHDNAYAVHEKKKRGDKVDISVVLKYLLQKNGPVT